MRGESNIKDGVNGTGNRKSIGIEICYSKSGGQKYIDAEANAVEYIAHVLNQNGWGIDRVKWHRDWSGKKCPHRIIDEGRTQSVKDRIEKRLKELNTPKKGETTVANTDQDKNAKPSPALAPEFAKAKEAGITDGTYPNRMATRAEVAVMNYRVYESILKQIK